MTATFGYDNLLDLSTATVTSSTAASGFDVENAYDGNSYDYWKATAAGTNTIIVDCGSSQNCDYFAAAAHDLSDNSGSIELFYSDTGTSGPWISLFTAVSPTDNTPLMRTFTSVSKRYYKVEIQDTGSASVLGVAMFGARLDLPMGMAAPFTPPQLSYNNIITTTESEGGAVIGRSVHRKGTKFKINVPGLVSNAFASGAWQTFLGHARLSPFFFAWDTSGHAEDVAFSWSVGSVPQTRYADPSLMKIELECEGFV